MKSKLGENSQSNEIKSAETAECKEQNSSEAEQEKSSEKESKFSLKSFFSMAGKKALFLTSVPFYWLIVFKFIIGWFDMPFFVFTVSSSITMSVFGMGWGVLKW